MIMLLLSALWYILPACFSNMAPVFASKLLGNRFTTPIDFGKKWNGKVIFGSHKTYRGFVAGIILAIIASWLQVKAYSNTFFFRLSVIDYSTINWVLWGFLLGFGALFGDLVRSFFKRGVGIKPGGKWWPFDQIDFIFGSLLVSSIMIVPPLKFVIILLLSMPIIAVISVRIGYYLHLRDVKW